jgi:hypothetical protein
MGFGGPLKAFPEWLVKGRPRPSSGRFTFTRFPRGKIRKGVWNGQKGLVWRSRRPRRNRVAEALQQDGSRDKTARYT